MAEDFGPTYITMVDEDTNEEFELEHLDTLDFEGVTYAAFATVPEDEEAVTEDDVEEVIILQVVEDEEGNEAYESVDDDELAEKIFQLFMDRISEEEEAE